MQIKNIIILIFFSLVVSACVTMKPNITELKVPVDRIKQDGYSLMPPNESGWIVAKRNKFQIDLVKRVDKPDETVAIQAAPVKIPMFKSIKELIRVVKETQSKNIDASRFTIKLHDVVSYSKVGKNCITSHFVTEDNAAVKRTDRTENMILEALSLICVHPINKKIGLSVTYSHRYYSENKDSTFIGKALNVLNSVVFDG